MERFYNIRNDGRKTDAEVLQAAMAEIRSMDKFKDPVYWAAFQLAGLPIN